MNPQKLLIKEWNELLHLLTHRKRTAGGTPAVRAPGVRPPTLRESLGAAI